MEIKNEIGWLFACCALAVTAGCESQDSATKRVFKSPLPDGTVVVNYDYQMMGPDSSEVFVLKTKDDKFLNDLIKNWSLKSTNEPSSAYDKAQSAWWPSHETRTAMDRKFENFNEAKTEFKSVWFDSRGFLYVELGEW